VNSGSFSRVLGLGTDSLHDWGVLLSLILLLGGLVGLLARILAALRGRPRLETLQMYRMIAVLGALGGFVAYLRDFSYSHALRDLTLGGLAAFSWMAIVLLESFRRIGSR